MVSSGGKCLVLHNTSAIVIIIIIIVIIIIIIIIIIISSIMCAPAIIVMMAVMLNVPNKRPIIFVFQKFGYIHLSAGELLREERAIGSENGDLIESYMKEGKIVPVEITISLIEKVPSTKV